MKVQSKQVFQHFDSSVETLRTAAFTQTQRFSLFRFPQADKVCHTCHIAGSPTMAGDGVRSVPAVFQEGRQKEAVNTRPCVMSCEWHCSLNKRRPSPAPAVRSAVTFELETHRCRIGLGLWEVTPSWGHWSPLRSHPVRTIPLLSDPACHTVRILSM